MSHYSFFSPFSSPWAVQNLLFSMVYCLDGQGGGPETMQSRPKRHSRIRVNPLISPSSSSSLSMIWKMRGHRVSACEVGSVGVDVLTRSRWTFKICCHWIQKYLHRWSKNRPVWQLSCILFFLIQNKLSFLFLERKGQSLLPSLASFEHTQNLSPLSLCT